MISKNKIKYIHSLGIKKNRDAMNAFVAEGPKIVGDIHERYPSLLKTLVATPIWIEKNQEIIGKGDYEIVEVDDEELRKVSFLCHPQQVLAIFEKPNADSNVPILKGKLSIALDGVQDPGNLGTIIRIADWFGIENIICSIDTADAYSPKVIQATMGSIARVKITYSDLNSLLEKLPSDFPIYGTLLEGKNIYGQQLSEEGVIVMGNEGKGISPAIRKLVNKALRIPNFPEGRATADSLNVAIATAITCSEFRRRQS